MKEFVLSKDDIKVLQYVDKNSPGSALFPRDVAIPKEAQINIVWNIIGNKYGFVPSTARRTEKYPPVITAEVDDENLVLRFSEMKRETKSHFYSVATSAVNNTINEHGKIGKNLSSSAAKRVIGSIKNFIKTGDWKRI